MSAPLGQVFIHLPINFFVGNPLRGGIVSFAETFLHLGTKPGVVGGFCVLYFLFGRNWSCAMSHGAPLRSIVILCLATCYFWQWGQKWVLRPAMVMRWMGVPQTVQGWPVRM